MPFSETQKLRTRRRAHFRCCMCQANVVEVHHIIPQVEGGDDSDENAAPLCPTCHDIYGANPVHRKRIREMRDLWYELCDKRYTGEDSRLDDMQEFLETLASKSDLNDAINRLEAIIGGARSQPSPEAFAHAQIMELSSILQELLMARKFATAVQFRRKSHLFRAIRRLPERSQEQWHALVGRALRTKLDTFWTEELVDSAICGELEQRIREDFEMSDKDFAKRIKKLADRDIATMEQEADVRLDRLSTKDAEWLQARQAPEKLYKKWCSAPETEKPLLMARWIRERKVRRIKFAPGDGPGKETPGFLYMRQGRELLVAGKKKEALPLIEAGIEIDDIAAQAFVLWLSNPFVEESDGLIDDREIRNFVAKLYGSDCIESIEALKRRDRTKSD